MDRQAADELHRVHLFPLVGTVSLVALVNGSVWNREIAWGEIHGSILVELGVVLARARINGALLSTIGTQKRSASAIGKPSHLGRPAIPCRKRVGTPSDKGSRSHV